MPQKLLLTIASFVLVISSTFVLGSSVAVAASSNDLIDDGVFDNSGTMSAAAIDNWLNSFSGSCISPNSGFAAADPTGYAPTSSSSAGIYSYGSTVTAGTVIAHAAQGHQINPQVLLTKLENEENLVTGVRGCPDWRVASAVGYACTDSGTSDHTYTYPDGGLLTPLYYRNGSPVNGISDSCVNAGSKTGFSEQVVHAAWLLSWTRHHSEGQTWWAATGGSWNHCDDNNTCAAGLNIPASWACYSHLMTQGSSKRCPTDAQPVYYDGYATIDNQSIHIDNGATAALYVYTPHIQSFDNIYTPWFGSPTNVCGSDPADRATSSKHVTGDYNANGRTDPSIFRPGDGCWHMRAYGDIQFGQSGDIPVPGDYNGDGRTDAAVYRSAQGAWHIRGVGDWAYGQSGDIPVPGDYNGDGRTDAAVYRPTQCVNGECAWHIRGVGDFYFGHPGDIPVPADYNGDGKTDIAVFRPSTGDWHVYGVGDFNGYGQSGDIPVPADYNGDGHAEPAVFRPSQCVNGECAWHIRAVGDYYYGHSDDIPVPGDYNGDGRTDVAIFRPSEGGWHVRAVGDYPYGTSSDLPVAQSLNAMLLQQYGLISAY